MRDFVPPLKNYYLRQTLKVSDLLRKPFIFNGQKEILKNKMGCYTNDFLYFSEINMLDIVPGNNQTPARSRSSLKIL